jgi:hypothetical protein
VPPRIAIGKRGDAKGGNVCRHVPAIRQQCHRATQNAGDDFSHHHRRRQQHDTAGVAFAVFNAHMKIVVVLPGF